MNRAVSDAASLRDPAAWLAEHADALDEGRSEIDLLARLAGAGLTRIGVPQALGGANGTSADVAEAVAALARHSLTIPRCANANCPICWRVAGPVRRACPMP